MSTSSPRPDEYWDATVETMPPDRLRATIEAPRLRAQLRHALKHSPFWRERFCAAGITSGDVDGGITLASLPLLEKKELLEDQVAHPPFGTIPAVSAAEVRRVHRTSGTTGRPYFVLLTEADIESTTHAGARAFWCAGVRPTDTVVHCLNYCMWSGGLTDHLCLERTGATVVPYGVGNSHNLLEVLRTIRPTCLSCTPSYLSRLEELLRDEFQMEPASLGLSKGLFGGEPGVQDPAFRQAIERTWGMEAVDANYGLSEALSVFGSECRHRTGLHFHGQGNVLAELIDPRSRAPVAMSAGATGELVLTHLAREAQPLFRYRTGDLVQILGVGDCPCGRTGFRFAVLGRSDDMLIIKGVNVFPAAFAEFIGRYREALSGAYRVVLNDRAPQRPVLLRVEVQPTVSAARKARLAAELEAIISQNLSVRVRIDWVAAGTLKRSEGKTTLVEQGA